MSLNYLLLWMVGISSLIAVLRSRGKEELEYKFSLRSGQILFVALIILVFVVEASSQRIIGTWASQNIGIILGLFWFVLLVFPQNLLNRLISNFELGKINKSESLLNKYSFYPLTQYLYWLPLWRKLFKSQVLLESGQYDKAEYLLKEIVQTKSIASYYARCMLLQIYGQIDDLINYCRVFTIDRAVKPSVYFSRILIRALCYLKRHDEAISVYKKFCEFHHFGSKARTVLLSELISALPYGLVGNLRQELIKQKSSEERGAKPITVTILALLITSPYFIQFFIPYNLLLEKGIFDPYHIFIAGEWWRLFSCIFLHAGTLHLATNLLGLYFLGTYLEECIGRMRLFILFLGSGFLASSFVLILIYLGLLAPNRMLGASGGVMGLVGAHLALYFISYKATGSEFFKRQLKLVLLVLAVQVVFDLVTPSVSFAAHLGGVISGLLLGIILFRKENRSLVD